MPSPTALAYLFSGDQIAASNTVIANVVHLQINGHQYDRTVGMSDPAVSGISCQAFGTREKVVAPSRTTTCPNAS